MIYWCNLCYSLHSLLVAGLFCYNAHFIITLFSLGFHHERYNKIAVLHHVAELLTTIDTG